MLLAIVHRFIHQAFKLSQVIVVVKYILDGAAAFEEPYRRLMPSLRIPSQSLPCLVGRRMKLIHALSVHIGIRM